MAEIIPIEVIARQASAAAALCEQGREDPPNPYCEHLQPEHHQAWLERFEIAKARRKAEMQDAEASA